MKKEFNTPAIEVFRMQVSEDLTVSDMGETIGFGLRGTEGVFDWDTK